MSEDSDPIEWPTHVAAPADVQAWISTAYPDKPMVCGPVAMYAAKDDFGVTARYTVQRSNYMREDVVFKANVYAGFSGAAYAFDLLSRHCPENAPHVIHWESAPDHSYILFRYFTGKRVREEVTVATLQKMAQTLAHIQVIIASLPASETATLPHESVLELPSHFDIFKTHIQTQYRAAWESDKSRLSSILGFPASEMPDRLQTFRSEVADWASELASMNWPNSICHGDLHGDNAIIQENQRILIYDWEDAVMSCPFLSLERLLVEAWRYDVQSDSSPWGFVGGTSSQIVVRDAYIDALPWRTRATREHACAIANCLAVIKEMVKEQRWAIAMGLPDGNPEWTAQLMSRLYHHRRSQSHSPKSQI